MSLSYFNKGVLIAMQFGDTVTDGTAEFKIRSLGGVMSYT